MARTAPHGVVGCAQRLPVAGGGPRVARLPASASCSLLPCGLRSALRCADGETRGDHHDIMMAGCAMRGRVARAAQAARRVRPATDRAQLDCPPQPRARQMQSWQHSALRGGRVTLCSLLFGGLLTAGRVEQLRSIADTGVCVCVCVRERERECVSVSE